MAVNADATFEPNETFLVNLSNATHATIADSQGVATIVDDDGEPAISIAGVSVREGNTGATSAVFTVSLSNPSSSAVSVSFATADGTATTANNDYVAAAGAITFAPHETTKTVGVPVKGDFVIEPNETFFVNLTSPGGATIAVGRGVGTIQNDDTVSTTLAALVAQATGCDAGGTAPQCRVLLAVLAAVQRDIAAGRPAFVVRGLQQLIRLVEQLTRAIGGRPPVIDPAVAATLIEEARSIIAALTT